MRVHRNFNATQLCISVRTGKEREQRLRGTQSDICSTNSFNTKYAEDARLIPVANGDTCAYAGAHADANSGTFTHAISVAIAVSHTHCHALSHPQPDIIPINAVAGAFSKTFPYASAGPDG